MGQKKNVGYVIFTGVVVISAIGLLAIGFHTNMQNYFTQTIIPGIVEGTATMFDSEAYFTKNSFQACVRKYGIRDSQAVTILGDTPRDMEAANANNARAVGVATGFYSIDELASAGASAVFRILEPRNELLKALGF